MKNRKKIVISVLLSFIIIFSWMMNENVFAAGKVKLNKKVATVTVGDTLKLKISGTKKKIKWHSSNKKVASVSSTGIVKAKKAGNVKITAKVEKKSYSCKIKIKSKVIPITSVTLDKNALSIDMGDTATLQSNVLPLNTTEDKTVEWMSEDTSIATVENGIVKGISAGTTKIIARAGKQSAECKIKIKSKVIPITSVTLDKNALSIDMGDTATLQSNVLPLNTTEDKTVEWMSEDTSIATVENGIVKGISAGTTKIIASAGNKRAECTVLVNQSYGSVSGNITYFYNNFKGNVSDTGAIVYLFSKEGDYEIEPTVSSYIIWDLPNTINSKYNKYGIYATKVDGTGKYKFQNIPVGEYTVFVKSKETTSGQAFKDKKGYVSQIQNMVSDVLNEENAKMLGENVGYHKCTAATIEIIKNQETLFSYDFGITYI
mgnify:CR=1 FL=1